MVSLAFKKSRLSRAAQPALAAAPRIDDEQNDAMDLPIGSKPIFAIVAPPVRGLNRLSVKDQPGDGEIDAMFGNIESALFLIPFI